MMLLMLAGLMPSRTAKREDQCAAGTFCPQVLVPGTVHLQRIVDQIALAGSQDRQQLGQVVWLGRSVKADGEALGGNPSRWQARETIDDRTAQHQSDQGRVGPISGSQTVDPALPSCLQLF
jgi:hypothetical protein